MPQMRLGKGTQFGDLGPFPFQTLVLTDTYVLSADSPTLNFLDPNGGDRFVDLPPGNEAGGRVFVICHSGDTATQLLRVRTSLGVAVCNVDLSEIGIVACNGETWIGGVGQQT